MRPLQQLASLFASRALVFGIAIASVAGVLSAAIGLGAASATFVCAVALAAIGIALALHVGAYGASEAQPRLGGQAQQRRAVAMRLALGTLGLVYLVLVLGTLVTSGGGLWLCAGLAACTTPGALSNLTLLHRGLAGLATLAVLVLAWETLRSREDRSLRAAALWSAGLILAQNLIGAAQIIAADLGVALPTEATRLAHLAVGMLTWGALTIAVTLTARLPYPQQAAAASTGATDTVLLSGATSKLKDYISLTKPGVISLLILTTIAAMYITPAGSPSLTLVFWTALGGWLMASGSHALNCYFDRSIDVNMGRTSRRPIPSGRIPAWHAAALGTALGIIAFAILVTFVNWWAAWLSLAGLVYYVVLYTLLLKRTTTQNIVIGGGAGAFPPLVGWAAATGGLTWGAVVLWLIIFYWTPPHFWALAIIREKDYARAGVPMLPVVVGADETRRQIVLYSVMLLAISLLPTPFGIMGLPYLAMASILGGVFLWYALRLRREATTPAAWGLYKYSLLYLALLFGAMVVDRFVVG